MTEKEQAAALALGVATGRRQSAERAAAMLRVFVERWGARVAARGPLLGPLLAGMTRSFVADLEKEAAAIDAQVVAMQAEEARLRAELEAAKVKPARPWWKR